MKTSSTKYESCIFNKQDKRARCFVIFRLFRDEWNISNNESSKAHPLITEWKRTMKAIGKGQRKSALIALGLLILKGFHDVNKL